MPRPRPAPVAALALALLAGCHTLDISQPIALVPDSTFDETDRQILGAAASCWNDEFGTDLRVPAPHESSGVVQQVQVGYLELVCAFAAGRTETTLPVRISICPLHYLLDPRHHQGNETVRGALFIVLTHEIGHALNILPHAEGPRAVMSAGGSLYPGAWVDWFDLEDRALLLESNPGFVPSSRCPSGHVRILADVDPPRCECR
jgi:hypothetical protein